MKGSTNTSARPNIRIQDASAEFVANTDTSTNAEFPYRASVSITGVTHYMSATVIYSQAQCISGAYSTYCQTYDGGVYLYAKTNVGTQTIPAISCDLSVNYINVENVPTSGSQSVITSGGIYTALGGRTGLTWDTTPTSGSINPVTSGGIYDALVNKEDKISGLNRAEIVYDGTLSITNAGSWNDQSSGTVYIPTGSPYYEASGGKIKIKVAGLYLANLRLVNSIANYEAISVNGSIQQNAVHNTQVVVVFNLSVNNIVTASLYGSAGSGTAERYNGLHELQITKL